MRHMHLARFAAGVALWTTLGACGLGGDDTEIPPAPTAAPPTSEIFVYVTEGRSPQDATGGGAISKYRLGADGFLPGGPPEETFPIVNARRLFKHPALDVIYVLGANQVFAFDITGGTLSPLCDDPDLAPPCATRPRPGAEPIELTVEQSAEGNYVLYVVEQGGGGNLSRIAAFELEDDGGLPGFPGTQGRSASSFGYRGVVVTPEWAYAADPSRSGFDQLVVQSDGTFQEPAPTPSPPGAPTPSPTPTTAEGEDPTPSPEPTATPRFFEVNRRGPAYSIKHRFPASEPGGNLRTIIYSALIARERIGSFELAAEDGAIAPDEDADSETRPRGEYEDLVVDPEGRRIYAAGFQIGRVDSFALNPDGTLDPESLSTTSENPLQFVTGIAMLDHVTASGMPRRTLFLSLGGLSRVDAYEIAPDGTIADLPFSSTEPRDDTFPTDVAVFAATP